jgi:hypothetical protein
VRCVIVIVRVPELLTSLCLAKRLEYAEAVWKRSRLMLRRGSLE